MLFNDLPLRTLTRNMLDMKKTLFIQIQRETGCYRVIVVFIRQIVIMRGARRVIWLDDHPCQEGRGKGSIFAGIWLTGENPLLSTYFSFSLSFMDDIFWPGNARESTRARTYYKQSYFCQMDTMAA